eukprot:PhF_6_TR4283/c0_g1_i3/m.5784
MLRLPSGDSLGPISTIAVPAGQSTAILPLTGASIWYVIQLPDQSRLRVVVSQSTTVADVVEAIALRHSDTPLLEECQLLRSSFPLSKRSRLCALAPKNASGGVNNGNAYSTDKAQANKGLTPAGRAMLANTVQAIKLQVDLEFIM